MLGDPIAGLRSPTGSLLSVYLDHPSRGGVSALTSDMLRPIKERASSMSRSVQKSVRRDSDRIHQLAEQLELDPAPSFAVFASDLDGIFVVESLTHQVDSTSTLGPRPYLRPLRAAPRPLRAGVLVADRTEARVFIASGELVEELGEPLTADIGRPNYGGFSGYREHTARAHAGETTSRMWKEAGLRLLGVHQDRPLDYLVIGALDEFVEEIGRGLHSYLGGLYRTSFAVRSRGLSLAVLRAELVDLGAEVRRNRQAALAGRVCDTAWSGGHAVLGLAKSIESANLQAIDTLVVSGSFARPGVVCNGCGHLSRSGEVCPVCNQTMFQVHDVVAAVMDSVVAAGGKVHHIGVSSPLDAEGIGAITRFQIQN